MDRFKFLLFGLILFFCSLNYASAYFKDGLYDGAEINYSPKNNCWFVDGYSRDMTTFYKKSSNNSGKYSIYYNEKGNVAFFLGSDFEFIKDCRLIASHNSHLNFYEVLYKNGEFEEEILDEEEVQNIFKGIEIIRISEFYDKKFILRKNSPDAKTYLILNDTDTDFFRYKIKPKSVQKTDIKGLITIKNQKTIEFINENNGEKYVLEVR